MTRFLPLVVGLLAASVCVRLGVWQLHRLEERRAHNAVMEAQLAEPPLTLDGAAVRAALTGGEELRLRRVAATGHFDFSRELVVIGRTNNGRPGIHVVTPLVIEDSLAVLVERGWLQAADGRTYDSAAAREPSDATVAGVLLQAPARPLALEGPVTWPLHVVSPDPASVAGRFPYTVLPLVLRRSAPPGGAALQTVPLPEQTQGPHLSYALQWFGFATIAVVGSTILYIKRRRAAES